MLSVGDNHSDGLANHLSRQTDKRQLADSGFRLKRRAAVAINLAAPSGRAGWGRDPGHLGRRAVAINLLHPDEAGWGESCLWAFRAAAAVAVNRGSIRTSRMGARALVCAGGSHPCSIGRAGWGRVLACGHFGRRAAVAVNRAPSGRAGWGREVPSRGGSLNLAAIRTKRMGAAGYRARWRDRAEIGRSLGLHDSSNPAAAALEALEALAAVDAVFVLKTAGLVALSGICRRGGSNLARQSLAQHVDGGCLHPFPLARRNPIAARFRMDSDPVENLRCTDIADPPRHADRAGPP